MPADEPVQTKPKLRWFHPSPGRLMFLLFPVAGILLLLNWLGVSEKGWAVLTAIACTILVLLILLLWYVLSLVFRWRFQFSIRSVLVLTVAVAIPFSWLAVEIDQAAKQRELVAALVTARATVDYDYPLLYRIGSPVLRPLTRLPEVFGDDFFQNIIGVCLYVSKTTDSDLERLEQLKHLYYLDLTDTRVTDAGLEHVAGFHDLTVLHLVNIQITDAGLSNVRGLNKLSNLFLNDTQITDAGLENLMGLSRLEVLSLGKTGVTDDGVERLQKALPRCKILR
jgi:hypothetical protein